MQIQLKSNLLENKILQIQTVKYYTKNISKLAIANIRV